MFEAGQQCTYTGKRVLVYDSVLYPNITQYNRDMKWTSSAVVGVI
jgi:hypothetical protein